MSGSGDKQPPSLTWRDGKIVDNRGWIYYVTKKKWTSQTDTTLPASGKGKRKRGGKKKKIRNKKVLKEPLIPPPLQFASQISPALPSPKHSDQANRNRKSNYNRRQRKENATNVNVRSNNNNNSNSNNNNCYRNNNSNRRNNRRFRNIKAQKVSQVDPRTAASSAPSVGPDTVHQASGNYRGLSRQPLTAVQPVTVMQPAAAVQPATMAVPPNCNQLYSPPVMSNNYSFPSLQPPYPSIYPMAYALPSSLPSMHLLSGRVFNPTGVF
jgi:hypothetical protein